MASGSRKGIFTNSDHTRCHESSWDIVYNKLYDCTNNCSFLCTLNLSVWYSLNSVMNFQTLPSLTLNYIGSPATQQGFQYVASISWYESRTSFCLHPTSDILKREKHITKKRHLYTLRQWCHYIGIEKNKIIKKKIKSKGKIHSLVSKLENDILPCFI